MGETPKGQWALAWPGVAAWRKGGRTSEAASDAADSHTSGLPHMLHTTAPAGRWKVQVRHSMGSAGASTRARGALVSKLWRLCQRRPRAGRQADQKAARGQHEGL